MEYTEQEGRMVEIAFIDVGKKLLTYVLQASVGHLGNTLDYSCCPK